MKNAPIRHRLEQLLYVGVKGTLRILPHGASRLLGKGLGGLAARVGGRRKRITQANLEAAFPELSEQKREHLLVNCYRHFGSAVCDTLSFFRFDPETLCKRLTLDGWEHLERAQAARPGVLILSAHLGHWEVAAHALGTYMGPLNVVGRPLDNPHLNRDLERFRKRFGNRILHKHGAARGMLKGLAAGELVGVLIDQRVPEKDGILVPFFGHPSRTSPALAKISLRTGAPVVPVFCVPEPKGCYRLVVRPPIQPEGDGDEAIAALTTRYLEATEEMIRRDPQQWLWMHDRWKR